VSFDNPRALFALVVLIPAAFAAFFHYRKRRAVLGFLSRDAGVNLVSSVRFRHAVSAAAFWLFLGCSIIALAQPRGGVALVSETRRGVDVIFAIDLSRSMEIRDISSGGPSRLDRAATLMTELVGRPWFTDRSLGSDASGVRFGAAGVRFGAAGVRFGAAGVRFGAAIGKGRGVLALPLTEDAEAIGSFLASLSGSAITGRGTNLESLLDAAAGAFQEAFPSRRRIILLSDGEALEGSLNAAADRAAVADIALVAVGLGSGEGGAVPQENDAPAGEDGRPVISSLRIDALKDAAERTGGIYMDGNRGNAAAQLAEHLSSLAYGGVSSGGTLPPAITARGFRREKQPLAHIFIIAALILMGISKIMEKGTLKNG
jgi:Ca-activated chloride channel family protein